MRDLRPVMPPSRAEFPVDQVRFVERDDRAPGRRATVTLLCLTGTGASSAALARCLSTRDADRFRLHIRTRRGARILAPRTDDRVLPAIDSRSSS